MLFLFEKGVKATKPPIVYPRKNVPRGMATVQSARGHITNSFTLEKRPVPYKSILFKIKARPYFR